MSISRMPIAYEPVALPVRTAPVSTAMQGTGVPVAGPASMVAATPAFPTAAVDATTRIHTELDALVSDTTVHTAQRLRNVQALPGSTPRGRPV